MTAEIMDVEIVWGGMQFTPAARGAMPSIGVRTVRRLRGWREPAPSAADTVSHWSVGGQVVMDDRQGARTIEMQGMLRARTAERVQQMQEDMARIAPHSFIVDELDKNLSRLATVRLVDCAFTIVSPLVIDYSVTLVADDPIRYGADTRNLSNGTHTIPNAGDLSASPTLALTGPHSALTITHPGGTYTFTALSSGQSRILDFREGDVWDGSTRVFGAEAGPRPVVRPGGSPWTVSGLGSGSAVLSRYEAWP